MYRYVENKQLLKEMQKNCSMIMKSLEEELRKKGLNSQVFLIGSGAKNMIMQNENGAIDFDYNLNVISCKDINNGKQIKELVRKTFNHIMKISNLPDVDDSTSSLTTKKFCLIEFPDIEFSIDLAIVTKDEGGAWFRLKHQKTGNSYTDRYFWNEAPKSKGYQEKIKQIKELSYWEFVREEYKEIKNMYLTKNDNNHPSFICFIEAVNNIYNHLKQICKL